MLNKKIIKKKKKLIEENKECKVNWITKFSSINRNEVKESSPSEF